VTEPSSAARPDPGGPPTTDARISPHLIAAIVVGVLIVVLAAQNSASAHIHLLFWQVRTPLYGLVVISALFGAAVAVAAGGLWRHRRRDHDDERRELVRLRGRSSRRAHTDTA
jgi:uncharacterized integral membrane protein